MEELPDSVFDAVVVGAGPAGCAAAAALSDAGKTVLLVDAKVDRRKVLSGELLHPTAVLGLAELGFARLTERTGGVPVRGFAVLEPDEPAMLLSYDALGVGVTVEHARLVETLQDDVATRPGVTFWSDARVEELLSHDADSVRVRVNTGRSRVTVRAGTLIVAAGRSGALREQIGIREHHEKVSTMLGLTVDAAALPFPEHGHVFVDGGTAPILAYAIGDGVARVLVDLPEGLDWKQLAGDPDWPRAVPEPLHSAMRKALGSRRPQFAANDVRLPRTSVRGRVCLVGDAAGCSHPISVSGITSAVRDALAMRTAFIGAGDARSALRGYARTRRGPQRTRIALASALYRWFGESTAEMELLRRGMRRYWDASIENQQASLALLAGRDLRMTAMAKEYGLVVSHALVDWSRTAIAERNPATAVAELMPVARLIGTMVPHARDALVGALSDTAGHLRAQAARVR